MEGIRKGTSRAPSPTRVRWKWYDAIVGRAAERSGSSISMIAGGNHTLIPSSIARGRLIAYPSGFLPRQKATSPDKGRRGCGANPGDGGRCGGRGEVTGSEKVGAAICRPPTPDHNPRKRAAGCRPYVCGRAWRASRTGRRGRRPLQGCGGNGTMPS